uniref:Uncharacterized protein n=1 Tax=Ascaris lumbricoides TaxID=6252 RepID=A0A0M3HF56_ASCLU
MHPAENTIVRMRIHINRQMKTLKNEPNFSKNLPLNQKEKNDIRVQCRV